MEFTWLGKTDFFPPRKESFQDARTLCIGTKSRNLGDALVLSTLPEKLKAKYPQLRISTYPRGFNPVVFANNPAVEGVDHLPAALYGDDANEGSGHLIQLKERFFGLRCSSPPRPRIHLSAAEIQWRDHFIQRHMLADHSDKPLCIIHPWGTTRKKVLPVEFWDQLVERGADRYRFWQVGVIGHPAVAGCEYYLLLKPKPAEARKLFAVISAARKFIGVDSGPMHVARAFDLPSLIFLDYLKSDPLKRELPEILQSRVIEPYFLNGNRVYSNLYPENLHVSAEHYSKATAKVTANAKTNEIEDFLSR